MNILREIDSECVQKKIIKKELQVGNTELKMTSINKVHFAKFK